MTTETRQSRKAFLDAFRAIAPRQLADELMAAYVDKADNPIALAETASTMLMCVAEIIARQQRTGYWDDIAAQAHWVLSHWMSTCRDSVIFGDDDNEAARS
jgi:hypothetical protein